MQTLTSLASILLAHAQKYPLMQPTDAVKLLYQNEFGGGHLIQNESACLNMLENELQTVTGDPYNAEDLGNGIVRFHLNKLKNTGISAKTLCRMFMYTANHHTGSLPSFQKKLELLRTVTAYGVMPFSSAELERYLATYADDGYPMVSHSNVFRKNYAPSYRIISERYLRLMPVLAAIEAKMKQNPHVVLTIDGRCASGKTTAAEMISYIWNAPVVHMDDFFVPPALRTPERYQKPGENVHYERFKEEVLPYLKNHTGFSYRKFSCSCMNYDGTIDIPKSPLVIVEGAYAQRPDFEHYADIAVFSDIEPNEQLRRIYERDGDYVEVFKKKWIPMEEAYIEAFDIKQKCDFII